MFMQKFICLTYFLMKQEEENHSDTNSSFITLPMPSEGVRCMAYGQCGHGHGLKYHFELANVLGHFDLFQKVIIGHVKDSHLQTALIFTMTRIHPDHWTTSSANNHKLICQIVTRKVPGCNRITKDIKLLQCLALNLFFKLVKN